MSPMGKCRLWVALFDMPNLNRFDILSISIFCKIALSISIFSKITISISISIFLELPCRYRYRYRYFSELPYRYRYFQLLHIDIDIDINIFQKCRHIDNRYVISIYRTGLRAGHWRCPRNQRDEGFPQALLMELLLSLFWLPDTWRLEQDLAWAMTTDTSILSVQLALGELVICEIWDLVRVNNAS